MIYLLNSLLMIGSLYDFSKKCRSLRNYFYIIIPLFLILFSGLRYEYGADYNNYYLLYTSQSIVSSTDILFFYLTYYLNHFLNLKYTFFILITAIFSVLPKVIFYRKFTQYFGLSLFIYFSLVYSIYDLGFIRQALALAIVCIVYYFDSKEDSLKSLIFIIIACLLHSTAAIVVVIKLLSINIKVNKRFFMLLGLSFFISNYLIKDFVLFITPYFHNDYIESKVLFYINNYPGSGFSFNIIRSIIVLVFLYDKKETSNMFRIYYMGTMIYFLFSFNVQFATRFYAYVLLLEPILVTNKLCCIKNKRIVLFIIYIFYSINFIYISHLFELSNYTCII